MFDAWIDNRFEMAKCISEHSEMNDFMNQANSNPTQTAAEATSKSAQCSLKSIFFVCARDQLRLRFILFEFLPPLSINNNFLCVRVCLCVCCSILT